MRISSVDTSNNTVLPPRRASRIASSRACVAGRLERDIEADPVCELVDRDLCELRRDGDVGGRGTSRGCASTRAAR
jgi:hypothetical protein